MDKDIVQITEDGRAVMIDVAAMLLNIDPVIGVNRLEWID